MAQLTWISVTTDGKQRTYTDSEFLDIKKVWDLEYGSSVGKLYEWGRWLFINERLMVGANDADETFFYVRSDLLR